MCRLFALSAGMERVSARFWLLEAPDSLELQSWRNRDGSGIGYFDEADRPVVKKEPEPAFEDVDFIATARSAVSRTFVSHVRYATTGRRSAENTHPFVMSGRMMAHNGGFGELAKLEAKLGDDLALVRGDTDSERFLALITQETRVNDGDVAAGIVAAADWIRQSLPLFSLNLVLAESNKVWALRYPDFHELYLLARPPGGHHGDRALHAGSDSLHIDCAALESHPSVVIASERMDEHPDWQPLRSGELVEVAPDLTIARSMVLPEPPVRFAVPVVESTRTPRGPEAPAEGGRVAAQQSSLT